MEKIKSLTWKYFIQQKAKEIRVFIIILICLGIFVLISIGFAHVLPRGLGCVKQNSTSTDMFGENQTTVADSPDCFNKITGNDYAAGVGITLGALVILCLLYAWIETNWRKAKRRAQSQLSKKRENGNRTN